MSDYEGGDFTWYDEMPRHVVWRLIIAFCLVFWFGVGAFAWWLFT